MKRILVIDDDEAVRLSLAFLLETSGFDVATAKDGREGLRRCDERRPDLVITDIMMPDVDGIETILSLRKAYGSIPILAISGGWHPGEGGLLSIVARLGATATLAKPFDDNDLLAAIETCTRTAVLVAMPRTASLSPRRAMDERRFACLVKRHIDSSVAE